MDSNVKATFAGALLGVLQATTINYEKLAYLDRVEVVKLGMAALFGYLGYLANKK